MDIEQTVRFILEMEAKHEVAMQVHDDALQKLNDAMRQADERFVEFREQTEGRFRSLVDVCASLTNNLQSIARYVEANSASIAELRESQAHTDRRLDALIDITQETDRTVKGLAKSQAETDRTVKGLAKSQAETDRTVKDLAKSQAETDRIVKDLAKSQADTDRAVKDLAKSQADTDRAVKDLAKTVEKLAKRNGRRGPG